MELAGIESFSELKTRKRGSKLCRAALTAFALDQIPDSLMNGITDGAHIVKGTPFRIGQVQIHN
jgi:hypothetical protein